MMAADYLNLVKHSILKKCWIQILNRKEEKADNEFYKKSYI